jgi:hypothetical protein
LDKDLNHDFFRYWDKWVESLDLVLVRCKESYKKQLLEYLVKQTRINLAEHQKKCNKHQCNRVANAEQIISHVQGLLDEMEEPAPIHKPLTPIRWKGTQKQLAELFIELKQKGWIEGFEYATIKACFNNANSIDQYLRPDLDKHTNEPQYLKVYTSEYDPKFYGIKKLENFHADNQ